MTIMRDGIDPETPWMRTTSGRHVSLLAPTPDMIDLDDIIGALRRLVRFTGHGRRPWTVAAHSTVVARIVRVGGWDDDCQRAALLHDATEAYIGDLSRPLKQSLRLLTDDNGAGESPLDVIEGRLWRAIAERFELPHDLPACVTEADNVSLGIEADDLFGVGTREAWGLPRHDGPRLLLFENMRGCADALGLS